MSTAAEKAAASAHASTRAPQRPPVRDAPQSPATNAWELSSRDKGEGSLITVVFKGGPIGMHLSPSAAGHVMVRAVAADGQAQAQGVRANDAIVSVDNQAVEDNGITLLDVARTKQLIVAAEAHKRPFNVVLLRSAGARSPATAAAAVRGPAIRLARRETVELQQQREQARTLLSGLSTHHTFPRDTGSKDLKLLSHEKALDEVVKNHVFVARPQKGGGIEKVRLPMSTSFGWHVPDVSNFSCFGITATLFALAVVMIVAATLAGANQDDELAANCMLASIVLLFVAFPLMAVVVLSEWAARRRGSQTNEQRRTAELHRNELYPFGVGMVLYFKMLKFLVALFTALALVTAPCVFGFVAGAEIPLDELTGLSKVSITTLGSLGGVEPLCISDEANQTLSFVHSSVSFDPNGTVTFNESWGSLGEPLECAAGTNNPELTQIEVIVGLPAAGTQCGCPTTLVPDGDGGCPSGMHRSKEPTLDQQCCSPHVAPSEAQWAHLPRGNATCRSKYGLKGAPKRLPPGLSTCATHVARALCASQAVATGNGGYCQLDFDTEVFVEKGTCDPDSGVVTSLRQSLQCTQPAAAAFATGSDARLQYTFRAQCYSSVINFSVGTALQATLLKTSWGTVVVVIDVLLCAIFFIATTWLRTEQKKESDCANAHSVTASDYTLWLKNLPPHDQLYGPEGLTKRLVEHLETVLNVSSVRTRARLRRGDKAGDLEARVFPVIHYVVDNSKLLALQQLRSKQRDDLQKRNRKAEAIQENLDHARESRAGRSGSAWSRLRTASENSNPLGTVRRLKAARHKCKVKMQKQIECLQKTNRDILQAIHNLDEQSGHATGDQSNSEGTKRELSFTAVSAFITFETEEARIRCEETYGTSWLKSLFQKPSLRMGRHSLHFELAPDPGNLRWENLSVSSLERMLRQMFVLIVTGVVLLFSFAGIWYAKNAYEAEKRKYPTVVCPRTRLTKSAVQEAIAHPETYGLIQCYCKAGMKGGRSDVLAEQFLVLDQGTGLYESQTLCQEWYDQQMYLYTLLAASTFGVLVVNLLLSDLMERLVKTLRSASTTGELCAVAMRVFLTQFTNTALVLLAVNGNLSQVTRWKNSPFNGPHSDLTVDWYQQVGSSLLLTMTINCVAPHTRFVIIPWIIRKVKLAYDRGFSCDKRRSKKLTQRSYDKLFMGPRFRLAARYGQSLNVIFVTLMFCGAMPMLLLVAAANFAGIYWVDKWAFLKFCKKPPRYDDDLANFWAHVVQLSLVVHFLITIWAYSSPSIFSITDENKLLNVIRNAFLGKDNRFGMPLLDRLFDGNAFVGILFIASLVVVGAIALEDTLWDLYGVLRRSICGRGRTSEHLPSYLHTLPREALETLRNIKMETGMADAERYWRANIEKYSKIVRQEDQTGLLSAESKQDIGDRFSEAEGQDQGQHKGRHKVVGIWDYNIRSNPAYDFVEHDTADSLRRHLEQDLAEFGVVLDRQSQRGSEQKLSQRPSDESVHNPVARQQATATSARVI